MIKQIAWNTFKKTGNIDTFIELTKVEDIERNIEAEEHGNNQNKWDNISRK